MNNGVIMSAPPKPLKRLMQPPKTEAKMMRVTTGRFSKIK
jgi:hypothetical protein